MSARLQKRTERSGVVLQHIGALVRARRIERGWNVIRLGREAGVTPATIYTIEEARCACAISTFCDVAWALDLSADDILGVLACDAEARRVVP